MGNAISNGNPVPQQQQQPQQPRVVETVLPPPPHNTTNNNNNNTNNILHDKTNKNQTTTRLQIPQDRPLQEREQGYYDEDEEDDEVHTYVPTNVVPLTAFMADDDDDDHHHEIHSSGRGATTLGRGDTNVGTTTKQNTSPDASLGYKTTTTTTTTTATEQAHAPPQESKDHKKAKQQQVTKPVTTMIPATSATTTMESQTVPPPSQNINVSIGTVAAPTTTKPSKKSDPPRDTPKKKKKKKKKKPRLEKLIAAPMETMPETEQVTVVHNQPPGNQTEPLAVATPTVCTVLFSMHPKAKSVEETTKDTTHTDHAKEALPLYLTPAAEPPVYDPVDDQETCQLPPTPMESTLAAAKDDNDQIEARLMAPMTITIAQPQKEEEEKQNPRKALVRKKSHTEQMDSTEETPRLQQGAQQEAKANPALTVAISKTTTPTSWCCDICRQSDLDNKDDNIGTRLTCQVCQLHVHGACYLYQPKSDFTQKSSSPLAFTCWACASVDRDLASKRPRQCSLCPVRDGVHALHPLRSASHPTPATDLWVHTICARTLEMELGGEPSWIRAQPCPQDLDKDDAALPYDRKRTTHHFSYKGERGWGKQQKHMWKQAQQQWQCELCREPDMHTFRIALPCQMACSTDEQVPPCQHAMHVGCAHYGRAGKSRGQFLFHPNISSKETKPSLDEPQHLHGPQFCLFCTKHARGNDNDNDNDKMLLVQPEDLEILSERHQMSGQHYWAVAHHETKRVLLQCRYCEKEYKAHNFFQMAQHVAESCTHAPLERRKELQEDYQSAKGRSQHGEFWNRVHRRAFGTPSEARESLAIQPEDSEKESTISEQSIKSAETDTEEEIGDPDIEEESTESLASSSPQPKPRAVPRAQKRSLSTSDRFQGKKRQRRRSNSDEQNLASPSRKLDLTSPPAAPPKVMSKKTLRSEICTELVDRLKTVVDAEERAKITKACAAKWKNQCNFSSEVFKKVFENARKAALNELEAPIGEGKGTLYRHEPSDINMKPFLKHLDSIQKGTAMCFMDVLSDSIRRLESLEDSKETRGCARNVKAKLRRTHSGMPAEEFKMLWMTAKTIIGKMFDIKWSSTTTTTIATSFACKPPNGDIEKQSNDTLGLLLHQESQSEFEEKAIEQAKNATSVTTNVINPDYPDVGKTGLSERRKKRSISESKTEGGGSDSLEDHYREAVDTVYERMSIDRFRPLQSVLNEQERQWQEKLRMIPARFKMFWDRVVNRAQSEWSLHQHEEMDWGFLVAGVGYDTVKNENYFSAVDTCNA